jgi:hypothetical protein
MQVAPRAPIVMTRDRAETGLIQAPGVHLERRCAGVDDRLTGPCVDAPTGAPRLGVEEALGRLRAALDALRALG